MKNENFLNEVTKLDAKKIALEKSDNFLAIVILIGIFLGGCIVGMIKGATFSSNKAKQSVVQELCEKHQYNFCEKTKILYKMKNNILIFKQYFNFQTKLLQGVQRNESQCFKQN